MGAHRSHYSPIFQGDFSYADMKHDGVVTVTILKQMTMTTVMTKDDDETMPMQA